MPNSQFNKLTLINDNSLVKSVSVISLSSTLLKNRLNDSGVWREELFVCFPSRHLKIVSFAIARVKI